jgi:hypothetical protein
MSNLFVLQEDVMHLYQHCVISIVRILDLHKTFTNGNKRNNSPNHRTGKRMDAGVDQ